MYVYVCHKLQQATFQRNLPGYRVVAVLNRLVIMIGLAAATPRRIKPSWVFRIEHFRAW